MGFLRKLACKRDPSTRRPAPNARLPLRDPLFRSIARPYDGRLRKFVLLGGSSVRLVHRFAPVGWWLSSPSHCARGAPISHGVERARLRSDCEPADCALCMSNGRFCIFSGLRSGNKGTNPGTLLLVLGRRREASRRSSRLALGQWLALVLVQHLDPGHQSSPLKLPSKSTTIPVCGGGRRAWRWNPFMSTGGCAGRHPTGSFTPCG